MSSALAERLRERRPEIEAAALARVHAVADPGEVEDPEYALGLREAVAAGIEYAIAALEEAGERPASVPDRLLSQARAAASNGVSLDTVLRRYSAGYTLLGSFLIQEAEAGGIQAGAEMQGLLRDLAAVFDRLIAAVTCAYSEQDEVCLETTERRRQERVTRLLAGELLDPDDLGYELDAWHLGALASGPGAVRSLRDLAAAIDRHSLIVRPTSQTAWAWLGGKRRLAAPEALGMAEKRLPAEVLLGLGEPGYGLEGWCLTHRQAKAAMPVARRGPEPKVRYADVALLASALGDELLAGSLRQIYVEPLEGGQDRGAALPETLSAYFAAGHNASSAAAALGVSRQTVSIRLRTAEERIGVSLGTCAAELETALRLRDFGHGRASRR